MRRVGGEIGFFQVGGTLGPQSSCYIERDADRELLQAIHQNEFVFILDSRQKGKSSLIVRSLRALEAEGITTFRIDLQGLGTNLSVDQWYGTMLYQLTTRLGHQEEAMRLWQELQVLGPMARLMECISQVFLPRIPQRLVIFVDEIDFVKALPFSADEFFAGIRDLYNRRADVPLYKKLNFCLVGVATPEDLIFQADVTPFNIGKRVELTDFTREQLQAYRGRLSEAQIDAVFDWTAGHPYLTQALAAEIAAQPGAQTKRAVEDYVRRAWITPAQRQSEPNFSDAERRILETRLVGLDAEESRIRTLETYGKVIAPRPQVIDPEEPTVVTLLLAGVVREHEGRIVSRNKLYRSIFDEEWRTSNLPDAEIRRQHVAARRATVRTASFAGIIILGFAALAVGLGIAVSQRDQAMFGLSQSSKANARLAYESSMQLATYRAEEGQYTEVRKIIESQKNNPLRGWEFDFWRYAFSNGERLQLPSNVRVDDFQTAWYEGDQLIVANDLGVWRGQRFLGTLPEVSKNSHFFTCVNSTLSLEERFQRMSQIQARHPGEIPVFTVGGQNYFLRSVDGRSIRLYSIDSTLVWQRSFPVIVEGIQVLESHSKALIALNSRDLWVVDLKTGDKIQDVPNVRSSIVKISPSERFVLTRSTSNQMEIRSPKDLSLLFPLNSHSTNLVSEAWDEQAGELITGGADGTIRIHDLKSGELKILFLTEPIKELVLCRLRGKRVVVTTGFAGEVYEYEVDGESHQSQVRIHQDESQRFEISRDGRFLLSSSLDGTVALWKYPSLKLIKRFQTAMPVRRHEIKFSPDSKKFGFIDGERTLKIIRTEDCHLLWSHANEGSIKRYEFEDGNRVFTVENKQEIWRYDTGTREGSRILRHPREITTFAVAMDKNHLIYGDIRGEVNQLVLESSNARPIQVKPPTLGEKETKITYLGFAPNGNDFAVCSYDRAMIICRFDRSREPKHLTGHTARIFGARFSPDGRRMATMAFDGKSKLYDVETGSKIADLNHGGFVAFVAWSPDGSRIVSGSNDGVARLWDGFSGNEYLRFKGHFLTAFFGTFSPDGTSILTTDSAGVLRRWNSGKIGR